MTRIRFEDLPSTNTPRNAENLNKLNNVVISSTEPTTGEEVWIQKGKNLINPKTLRHGVDLTSNGTIVTSDTWFITDFVEAKENCSYYMSGFKNDSGTDIAFKGFYDKDYNFITVNRDNPCTIPSGVKYVIIAGHIDNSSNLLFTQSDIETSYEPYIDKKIYTKNDNDVYEKFYDETNLEIYSTEEQRIGTWIDGKPLYRKTFYSTSISGSTGVSNQTANFIRYKNVNIRSNEFIFPPARYTNAQDTIDFYLNINNGEFNIQIGTAWESGFKYVIFDLEYTKTTD